MTTKKETKVTKLGKPVKLLHSKTWYTDQLRNNICRVVFEKKDGTLRTMRCTTQGSIIDTIIKPGATAKTVTVPETQVRVMDLDKGEWRSFNTDSVIEFEIEE